MTSLVLSNWAQAFALHSYILWYPMILLAYSEDPEQTADAVLIWAFTVPIYPKTRFCMAWPI